MNEEKKRDKSNTFWKPMVFIHPFFSLVPGVCMPHAQSLQSRPPLCDSTGCSLPGSSVHGILPNSGIEPGSPALQADSLPSEPTFILTSLQILLLSSSFSFIKFSTPFFPNMLSMGHLELVTLLLKKSGFLQNNAHSSLVLCLKHDRKDFQFYF